MMINFNTVIHVCLRSGHALHTSSFTIRLGTNRVGVPDPNSRVHKVDKIIVHAAYDAFALVNDIALVRVTQSIEYTDYIRPVCVADSSYDIANAVECYISGWGADTLDCEFHDHNYCLHNINKVEIHHLFKKYILLTREVPEA